MKEEKQKKLEEEVAALTEEQKDTILKVAKYATIIEIPIMIIGLSIVFGGLFLMFINLDLFYEMGIYLPWQIHNIIFANVMIGGFIFIKCKFPYYSDRKAAYIKKSRKNKSK
ncbi:MAG: hypothetical protein IKC97_00055 [Clostridia bacterium]|nr:hypothetical protein [Clostridia bacterium]